MNNYLAYRSISGENYSGSKKLPALSSVTLVTTLSRNLRYDESACDQTGNLIGIHTKYGSLDSNRILAAGRGAADKNLSRARVGNRKVIIFVPARR